MDEVPTYRGEGRTIVMAAGGSRPRTPVDVWPAVVPALLVVLVLCVGGCGPAPDAGQAQQRPNVVVVMTDDQTLESMRVMTSLRSALAARGTMFEQRVRRPTRSAARRARPCFTGQYSHNHGVLHNAGPCGGYSRLDTREQLPVWLQRAGYRTVHVGRYLNGYGQDSRPTEVPPGWSDWYASVDPSTYQFNHATGDQRERRAVSTYRRYSTGEYADRLLGAAPRVDRPGRAVRRRPSSCRSVPRAAQRRPARPRRPPAAAARRRPPPRHRGAFATEPLPRGPASTRRDVSRQAAASSRERRPLGSARTSAAIEENYRQELESLLAVDEAVVRIVDALRDTGELEQHAGRVHLRQRLLPRRAPRPDREGAALRAGHPGAAGDARPGRAARTSAGASWSPTSTWRPRSSRPPAPRPAAAQDGRSLFGAARATPGSSRAATCCWRTAGRRERRAAFVGLRTNRFLYAEHENGARELYDLGRDPYQLRSLHADPRHASLQARLAERLAALQVCAGASCRTRPRVRLSLRACRPRVTGRAIERVRIVRLPGIVRARVRTRDGRVVTLDRRLPPACA